MATQSLMLNLHADNVRAPYTSAALLPHPFEWDSQQSELRGINTAPRKVSREPSKQRGVPGGPLDSSQYRSGPVLN